MLVKLLPEQISEYWDIIKYAVENSLPPIANEAYDKMNRILEALLCDSMQCWVLYSEIEDKRKLEAVVVTTLSTDLSSGVRSLMVYSLYGFSDLSDEAWKSGYETLARWGKGLGCNRVTAYTDVPKVCEVVKNLGGEARYMFVSLPL